jgi:hypothetical protein
MNAMNLILISRARRWAAPLLLMLAAAAPAAAESHRPLPDAVIVDRAGMVTRTAALQPGGPWALLMLDAGMASSQAWLDMLAQRPQDYGNKLVIVATGTPKAVQDFIDRNQKLQGMRWFSDGDPGLASALRLSATPSLYAIDGAGQIAWQVVGTPRRTRVETLIRQWLRIAPAAVQP